MASNRDNKGKGIKGGNYDELSGVGTSRAGITGTTGNLNDGGHDGGIGTPDDGDAGNRQSAGHGQPGGTPALGRSQRGQARLDQSDLASGPGDNTQRGAGADRGNLQSGGQDRQGERTPESSQPDGGDLGFGSLRQR